jgi:hypothetical protein
MTGRLRQIAIGRIFIGARGRAEHTVRSGRVRRKRDMRSEALASDEGWGYVVSVRLFIPGGIAHLADLLRICLLEHPLEFARGSGIVHLGPIEVTYPEPYAREPHNAIEIQAEFRHPTDAFQLSPPVVFSDGYFEFARRGDAREYIEATCFDPRATNCFYEILLAIAQEWPASTGKLMEPIEASFSDPPEELLERLAQRGLQQQHELALISGKKTEDLEDKQTEPSDSLPGLPPTELVWKHFPDYSPTTALWILSKLPDAYRECVLHRELWGPKYIASKMGMSPSTVSHYLSALWQEGLTEWANVPLRRQPGQRKRRSAKKPKIPTL